MLAGPPRTAVGGSIHLSMSVDPLRFLSVLGPALWRAAAIARRFEGSVENAPKVDEDTPAKQALTAGDTAAQEAILEVLLEHFPEVGLAAEEDTPSVPRFRKRQDLLVVIDPIDGTLHSYLEGKGPYAVMVGLVVRDVYEAALIALPREGLLYRAARGRGAELQRAGGEPRPVRAEADGDRIIVSNGMPTPVSDYLRERGHEVIPACGGVVAIAPLIRGVCAGVRRSATGDISIRGRIGALIAREGGAVVETEGGRAFPTDVSTGAATLRSVCDPADLPLLEAALATASG